MSENNTRERLATLEEQSKTLFRNVEDNKKSIHEMDKKIDAILSNDLPHLHRDNRRFLAKVFGAGGAGALLLELVIRYIIPALMGWYG